MRSQLSGATGRIEGRDSKHTIGRLLQHVRRHLRGPSLLAREPLLKRVLFETDVAAQPNMRKAPSTSLGENPTRFDAQELGGLRRVQQSPAVRIGPRRCHA